MLDNKIYATVDIEPKSMEKYLESLKANKFMRRYSEYKDICLVVNQ